jgi:mediator of RNA polymerase II transcription subunit 17
LEDDEIDIDKPNDDGNVQGTAVGGAAPGKWPWESVRDRLRDALAEVSVLSDVISVATKECGRDQANNPKRYMVLDGPTMYETPEQKPYVSLLAKKKALDGHVAKILLNGSEHMRSLQSENKTGPNENSTKTNNFHFELLKLRQHWRLKKVSNTILGDLSFRTAGSQFKQSGIFEVVKADTEETDDDATTASSKSVLKVNVPSELEGIAFIQVVIQKESEQLVSTNICHGGAFDSSMVDDVHWKTKLEQAQNVIFCKELFAQLAKEAIQLQAPVPHMVVGNQISCSLFPDIQLLITLWYKTGSERKTLLANLNGAFKSPENEPQSSHGPSSAPQPAKEHSHVLEHSLHQLLRKAHMRNLNPESGGLSSSPVGVSKRRRLAGPKAADRSTLLHMAEEETFLEQIILQGQHVVLRLRTMYVLDTMAASLKDPLITFHWSTLSSPTRTSVKVSIVTAGYDTIQRTQLVIHVYAKTLTFVCKDGRVLHFSHEPQELRDFILCQISQHQVLMQHSTS